MKRADFEIASTWDGERIPESERARVTLAVGAGRVEIDLDAPFHGDPAPAAPVGRLDGLWDHEVVELFLLGADERYLELEFGPHGHWLGLVLDGVRAREGFVEDLQFDASVARGRWHGRAVMPDRWLPEGLRAANAYSIHGQGEARRYLAAAPVPGPVPDFHRLEAFPALVLR